jgi:cobalamin biosynthesis Mg chelatase CobN
MIYTMRGVRLGAQVPGTPATEEFPPELYRIPTKTPAVVQTTQPGTAPPPVPDPCVQLFASWSAANPQLDKCLNSYDRSQMLTACHAGQSGRMTQAQATETIQKIVAAACARAVPPPTTQTPTPPSSSQPSTVSQPTSQSSQPSSSGPGNGSSGPGAGAGGGGTGPSSNQKSAGIYQWGAVVGIVILLGAGVYYVRGK